MKIAIIGYGRMGHEIEKMARERNHKIAVVVDENNCGDFTPQMLSEVDVAIEFSTPDSAPVNILTCFRAGVPVVCGTTGWQDKMEAIKDECIRHDGTFFYTSNFSIGVNLLFSLNRILARLMNNYPDYEPRIEEIHHIHKLDSPSGTAITLADDILRNLEHKTEWVPGEHGEPAQLPVKSVREGEVPGIHRVTWESDGDILELYHSAKNRRGFALGAILAAEFVQQRKGVLGMNDMLGLR